MAISTRAETRGGRITPEPPCLLEFRNIRIVYDNAIEAIRDVSIGVPEGGIVALLGSNGAGKSTLLKAMSGILYTEEGVIESGTIRFRNEDVHRLAPDELVRRGIVQVPEGRRVFPALTIDENLQMGGYTRTSAEARDRRDQVFALFPRLFERRDQIAGYMSGGEQQMLAIGRALMTGPVLLALDEPSLGLAPLIIDRIYEVIVKLRDEMKMTVGRWARKTRSAHWISPTTPTFSRPGALSSTVPPRGCQPTKMCGSSIWAYPARAAKACATSSTTSGARGGCRDRAAFGRKHQQEFWRPQGHFRRQSRRGAGSNLQRHRSQRRRKDHAVQHHQRRAAAKRRPYHV